jgi:hypothetical protein
MCRYQTLRLYLTNPTYKEPTFLWQVLNKYLKSDINTDNMHVFLEEYNVSNEQCLRTGVWMKASSSPVHIF